VADSGKGIPLGAGDCVFDAFFTTKAHGMGMGLPVSRTIVAAHGGRIWMENNRGPGATFRFTVPVAR
jgi:signal transduction histidine kinase